MDDGLEDGAPTGDMLVKTHFGRLSLIEFEDDCQRAEDERNNNGERAVRPSPSRMVQIGFAGARAGKSCADEWSADECIGEGTVAQTGGIGHKDIQDQVDGVVADIVEDVTGGIGIGTVAGGEDDQSNYVDQDKKQEAFGTAPYVQSLCNGQLEYSGHDGGQNAGRRNLGSGRESGIGLVDNGAIDRVMEGEDEDTHPDPGRLEVLIR